jgi:ABC-type transport system involved in resistance to organic solvents, ATPase component
MDETFRVMGISYSFGDVSLLRNISFEIPEGGALVIGGRSGCGKSTLLEICASLRTPKTGEVFWEGKNIADFNHEQLTAARQRIGFVFQKHALIHNFTIFDNIALPLRYHTALSEKDIRIKVKRCMDEFGLFNVDGKFSNQLSAGQSKCAAIARALVLGPRILFVDEPTAGIDPFTEECVANVFNHLRGSDRLTICMICNDIQTIRHMNCPVKILEEGKLFDIHDTTVHEDAPVPAVVASFREML